MKPIKPMKILVLLMIFTLPMIMMAQPRIGARTDKNGQGPEHPIMIEKLNLSEEQAETIDQLKTEQKKTMIQLEADLKLARIELDELIKKEASENKIDDAIDKVSKLKAKAFKARVHHRLEISKILTDEQKDLLKKERLKKMRKHRQSRKDIRRGPGRCNSDCPEPEMAPESAPTE